MVSVFFSFVNSTLVLHRSFLFSLLVELNSTGHLEPEKGLDDPTSLIDSFVDLIFV